MSVDAPAAPATVPPTRTRRGLPFAAVLGLVTAFSIMLVAKDTLRDVDIYWHLIAGGELAAGRSPADLGTTWSFAPDPVAWVSTQWLGEWLFHLIFTAAGWTGIAVYRTVTAAAVMAVLAYTTVRGRPPILAAFPYAIGVVAVAAYSQERTQQFTYLGAAALGGIIVAGLVKGNLPRWWIVVPATILWANLHGGWILVPAAFGLIALGRWLDHGLRDRVGRDSLGLAVAAVLCGLVSPAGLANVTAVFRISDATDVIQEWAPVTPTSDVGVLSLLLWIVVLVAWSGPGRLPRSEVVTTVALFVFGWMAWRNIVVAMLMLIPLIAHRMVQRFPTMAGRVEPAWSAKVGIGIASAAALFAVLWLPSQEQLPREEWPVELAASVSELPADQRVLNDYNIAGLVLLFGGEGTQVGIDGRTDRYGPDYINDYTGMVNLNGDWQQLLDELAPTSALLEEDAALAHVLVAERQWVQLGEENGFVLLRAPQP